MPLFLLFVSDLKRGFRGLAEPASLAPFTEDALGSFAPYVPYAVLVANMITQLACVSGVNQLSAVRSSPLLSRSLPLRSQRRLLTSIIIWTRPFLGFVLCSSWRSARLLGVDEPRPDGAQGDQPLLQRVVVRQRVERPARARRRHGVPRLPALHRGYLTGKQTFACTFFFPELQQEQDGKQCGRRRERERERRRQGEEAAEGEGRVIP